MLIINTTTTPTSSRAAHSADRLLAEMSAAQTIAAVRSPASTAIRTLTPAELPNTASPSLLGTPLYTPRHRHLHRNPPASHAQSQPSALNSTRPGSRDEQEEDPFGPLKRSVSRRVGKPLEPLRPSMNVGYGNASSVLEDSWSDGEDEADEGIGEEQEQEDEEGGSGSSGAENERLFGGDARGGRRPGREVAQKAEQMLGVRTGAGQIKKTAVQARGEDDVEKVSASAAPDVQEAQHVGGRSPRAVRGHRPT